MEGHSRCPLHVYVNILGQLPSLSRRQTAIIAYALQQQLGGAQKLMQDPKLINSMGGILCGYSPQTLEYITPEVFINIDVKVFRSLHGCTFRQLRV